MAKQTKPAHPTNQEETDRSLARAKVTYSPEEAALRLKLARDHRANKRVGPGWKPKLLKDE